MQTLIMRSVVHPVVAFAVLASASFANVIVVDASGGGDYTQIQPAVDAASDGDVLLVKNGSYASFVVDDKALTIVGDTGASDGVPSNACDANAERCDPGKPTAIDRAC